MNKSLNEKWDGFNRRELLNKARELVNFIEQAHKSGLAAHDVEEALFRQLIELDYRALGMFLCGASKSANFLCPLFGPVLFASQSSQSQHYERYCWVQKTGKISSLKTVFLDALVFVLCGDGDEGEAMTLADGQRVRRLGEWHKREYQSVFGLYELWRVVYGTRAGQKIEHVPLDAKLNLQESKFSYGLQDWDQSLNVEGPPKFSTLLFLHARRFDPDRPSGISPCPYLRAMFPGRDGHY
jgi:hypothetical protein